MPHAPAASLHNLVSLAKPLLGWAIIESKLQCWEHVDGDTHSTKFGDEPPVGGQHIAGPSDAYQRLISRCQHQQCTQRVTTTVLLVVIVRCTGPVLHAMQGPAHWH